MINKLSKEVTVVFNKALIYSPEHEVVGFIGSVDIPSRNRQQSLHLKCLTMREIDVLNLLVKGSSAKVISVILGISSHTVTSHLRSIYSKLGARSKGEAVYKTLILLNMDRSL